MNIKKILDSKLFCGICLIGSIILVKENAMDLLGK